MPKGFHSACSLAIVLLACAGPARSQQLGLAEVQDLLQGAPWAVSVQGEPRSRVMVVESVVQKSDGVFEFSGTYNYADSGKTSPLKGGEVTVASGKLTMTLASGAGSTITASANPDGNFTGTIKYPSGSAKQIQFVKGGDTTSAPRRAMLGKAEVQALVAGKTLTILRPRDSAEIVWSLNDGGELLGQNYKTNSRDSGRWEVNDRGALCTTWRSSGTGCSMFHKDGDKYTMHASPSAAVRYQVLSIK